LAGIPGFTCDGNDPFVSPLSTVLDGDHEMEYRVLFNGDEVEWPRGLNRARSFRSTGEIGIWRENRGLDQALTADRLDGVADAGESAFEPHREAVSFGGASRELRRETANELTEQRLGDTAVEALVAGIVGRSRIAPEELHFVAAAGNDRPGHFAMKITHEGDLVLGHARGEDDKRDGFRAPVPVRRFDNEIRIRTEEVGSEYPRDLAAEGSVCISPLELRTVRLGSYDDRELLWTLRAALCGDHRPQG